MLFKKVFSLSLCLGITQVMTITPAFADTNKTTSKVVRENTTGVKPLIKFETDPKVNINLSNAAVIDVLKALTDQVGYNLVVNTGTKSTDDVIPRIDFTDVRLSEAMSFILRLKNLGVRKIGKTLFIADQAQFASSGLDDSVVKTYKLANIKPGDAITKISEYYVLPLTPPKLVSNEKANAITAIVRPADIEFLDSIMPLVDANIPQVSIEIKLIELSEQASKNLSFSYGFGQRQFGGSFNNSGPGGTPAVNPGSTVVQSNGLTLNFQALRDFTANFNVQIDALVQNSKAKILSNPRISTQNGIEATFKSTESVPVIQTTQTAAGQTQSVKTIDIGENIKVLPTLVDPVSGFVTLELTPEISTRGKDVIVNNNPVPETLTRAVKTTMKVKSGEAIIIGGLKRRNNTNASNKIPLLGDIPIIGALFGSNSYADNDTELIIMVTPYILDDYGNAPKAEVSLN